MGCIATTNMGAHFRLCDAQGEKFHLFATPKKTAIDVVLAEIALAAPTQYLSTVATVLA